MTGHLQGQAAKLYLSVINPFALSTEGAAVPSDWVTTVSTARAHSAGAGGPLG